MTSIAFRQLAQSLGAQLDDLGHSFPLMLGDMGLAGEVVETDDGGICYRAIVATLGRSEKQLRIMLKINEVATRESDHRFFVRDDGDLVFMSIRSIDDITMANFETLCYYWASCAEAAVEVLRESWVN